MSGNRLHRALESNGRHFERAAEQQLPSFAAPAETRRHCMLRAEPEEAASKVNYPPQTQT